MTNAGPPCNAPLTREALGQAFDDRAQAVFRYCARHCGDRGLAEDLMSVVFLEAWRSRDRALLIDNTLRPWLLGIAANVVSNSRRSLRRHRAALDRYQASADRLVEPDHADSAVAAADASWDRARLDVAFAALSTKDRQVADLCLIEGLSPAQAAVALSLPIGTVKSRLAHARDRLRGVIRADELDLSTDPKTGSGHGRYEHHVGAPAEGSAA